MELKNYIEMGAQKAGSLTALGNVLGMTQPQISGVKAHRKPLPDKALVTLAEYIGVPEKELIAANNIAMGKNIEFWSPFVQHAKAASIALAVAIATNFVTPSPAQAVSINDSAKTGFVLCKLTMILAWLKQRKLFRSTERLKELFKTLRTPQIA